MSKSSDGVGDMGPSSGILQWARKTFSGDVGGERPVQRQAVDKLNIPQIFVRVDLEFVDTVEISWVFEMQAEKYEIRGEKLGSHKTRTG